MEPMTLGSPVQSPIHLGAQPQFPSAFQHQQSPAQPAFHSTAYNSVLNHHGGGANTTPLGGGLTSSPAVAGTPMQMQHAAAHGAPGFLPGYLMGQPSQQSTGRVVSPQKLNRSISTQSNTPSNGPSASKHIDGFLTPTTPASSMRTPSEKPGGPPIKGLSGIYGNRGGTPSRGTPGGGSLRTPGGFGTPLNTTPQLSFGANQSGVRDHDLIDSSCHEGTTWVTIFGFPPSAASYILSQFSQCGTVLQHQMPPNGNWMNIRFQTKMQAQKALGRSGRVLGGSLMIGVTPCLDPPADAINSSHVFDQTGPGPADSSVLSLNSSLATHGHNRSIRPLTQSYKAAHNEHEISALASTPNKSTGIVTKAMEYIFGW